MDGYDLLSLYEPPTQGPYVYIPGPIGGANWHGAAFDPETRMLYVSSVTLPSAMRLVEPDPEVSDYRLIHEFVEGDVVELEGGLPVIKPPYGRITAYDMNTGEIVWMAPRGEGPRDHPALRDLDLPRLGWPLRGAPLLTKSLLLIGQEAKSFSQLGPLVLGELTEQGKREGHRFHAKFFGYDKATGELLAEIDLPANVMGAPMTYTANGKQYVVFAVGGLTDDAELIALSLP